MSCYSLKKVSGEGRGIFQDTVDVCVILICCKHNNYYREQDVMNKLKTHHLHSETYIVYNDGFRNCKKPRVEQPDHDLSHAQFFIFEKFRECQKILYLEDDYQFDDRIYNHIDNINNFVNNNSFDAYSLGSKSFLNNPLSVHQRCIDMYCAHGVIYSQEYFEKFFENYKNNDGKIIIDRWWNTPGVKKYRYFLPVCYQTFPETENRKTWDSIRFSIILIKLLNADKSVHPAWEFYYIFPYLLYIILLYTALKVLKLL